MSSESADVETGDELILAIEDTGEQGDGIAHTDDGFVVVVPDGSIGERHRVTIDTVEDDFAVAETLEADSRLSD